MWRTLTRLAWWVCLSVAVLWHAAPAAAQTVISSIAVIEQAGVTRLIVDLSQRAEYRVHLLGEPMRLVVDLPPVRWRLPAGPAASQGLVAGYRFGSFDARTGRLVIDLAAPARVRKSGYDLPNGKRMHRLVIDLERISPDAFAAEVQPWTASGAMLTAPAPAPAPPPPSPAVAVAPAAQVVAVPATPATPPPGPIAKAQAAPPRAAVASASMPAARVAPRRPDGKRTIVLDPGHGGVDPGAIGASGAYEKDITLAMAREIRRQLEATGRYRVALTRDEDVFVQLRDRTAKARTAQAELFLSIHADSIGSKDKRGASFYTLSETASDAEAAALAARENRADIIAGVDLSAERSREVVSILIDLAQRESMNLSAAFAGMLVDELGRDIQLIPNNPHRFAGFAVLKAPDVPSVLLELGYLSNRHDEGLLRRPHHRSKVAAAVVRAIDHYFDRKARS